MDVPTQIPYSIAGQLISLLGSPALQEIKWVCGAEKELEKLKATLDTINDGLSFAEQLQQTNKLVEGWIRRVSDVLYDADDLLDEVATEGLRKNVDPRGRIAREVCDFFSSSNQILFRVRMGHKIKEIRERLDGIKNDMSHFSIISHKGVINSGFGNNKRETNSGELKDKYIGREKEEEEIIELLLHPADQNLKNVAVVAIVGMGGLGKTTLAQNVYNDERVKENFSERMWVCVSEDFNVKTLLTKILKFLTRYDVSKLELEQLQRLLREKLEGKKYLLALDDVWNENKEKWDQLEKHLCFGAQGSKILVTTRSKRVARIMGVDSNNLYELKGLRNDDSWNLFKQVAFGGDKEGASSSRLLEVERELVRERCKGVPLAIKTLGSAVLSYPDEAYWLSMKENDRIWSLANNENEEDSILPVLKLSYYHLPNHLKECFVYFSVFPKNVELPKEMLIPFWLARGYVQSSTGGKDLEEIAKMYLNELLSRFFFEETGRGDTMKMHDLIHDLAQVVSKSICLTHSLDEQKKVPKEVHHISFAEETVFKSNEIINILKSIIKGKTRLRTLFIGNIDDEEEAKSNFLGFVFSNFKCLRVLGINFPTVELPSSIRRLKHLRCLILRGCQCEKLPGTICNLLNLQTLFLIECDYLEELPKDLRKLVRLRHLFIIICPSLASLPDCFRHLSSLQRLEIAGCYELSNNCRKNDGPDWWKIQHIPNICTDWTMELRREDYGASNGDHVKAAFILQLT